jgi:hypothetical protein
MIADDTEAGTSTKRIPLCDRGRWTFPGESRSIFPTDGPSEEMRMRIDEVTVTWSR